MDSARTTAAIQEYLDELAGVKGSSQAEPVVRGLLSRSADRLHLLCAALLHRSYPRLTRPPLNLQSDEMLSAVVERLIKALREARPGNVRQFFAIANQHMRWELNDLARRLDEQTRAMDVTDLIPASPDSSQTQLSPIARRMYQAIDELPPDEREVFELVRIQGMTHPESAQILGVSEKTVQRRLARGLVLLAQKLPDLDPRLSPSHRPA